jgi:hypothetical protein
MQRLLSRIKLPESDSNQPPACSAEIKNVKSFASTPSIFMTWYLGTPLRVYSVILIITVHVYRMKS